MSDNIHAAIALTRRTHPVAPKYDFIITVDGGSETTTDSDVAVRWFYGWLTSTDASAELYMRAYDESGVELLWEELIAKFCIPPNDSS